jgi:hypothetical protein
MCKWQRVTPRHKGSPRYRIAHGWKIEYGSFNLEALNFLMHFRESGSSLYFCTYSYFSLFLLFLSFFLSFILFLIHSFFCHTFGNETFTSEFWFFYFAPLYFFIYSPLNSKNCIVPTSSPMLRRCSSSSKEAIKVSTGNTFPLERYLKSSILAPSIFLELMIHTQW